MAIVEDAYPAFACTRICYNFGGNIMELKKDFINVVKDIKYKDHSILDIVVQQKKLQVNDELICDILALPDFKKTPKVSLDLIKTMAENGIYSQLIQEQLSILVTEGYILSLSHIEEKFESITCSILSNYGKLGVDLINGYIYILEELYAKGIDVRKALVSLLRTIDDNNPTKRYDADVIRIKIALVAYGAGKYNCHEQLECLDYYANYIKKNGLSNLKGAMHYYYAIFKERFPNCVSSVYSNDIRHSSYGHLLKSKKKMFRLAEIKYNYC